MEDNKSDIEILMETEGGRMLDSVLGIIPSIYPIEFVNKLFDQLTGTGNNKSD
ncbi:MAG: hypothetical protein IPH46_16575 [Bacteroidetes bacterium]|nr:hypothetical protein [Bacteroidota bacterium]MBK9482249.1 hypothetical protein [Bacteroidota bacterium]